MDKKTLGRRGESLAAHFLLSEGYSILQENWRFSRAEIDLIASKDNLLVFVEVKTRASDFFGEPEMFVDEKKKGLMAEAAAVFCEQLGHQGEIRFDVISIVWPSGVEPKLRHLPDAFFPGLF